MSQWIEISTLAALADSAYERFEFEDIDVLVFREGSHVYAIEDLCTHDGAELCGDSIWMGKLNVHATAHASASKQVRHSQHPHTSRYRHCRFV